MGGDGFAVPLDAKNTPDQDRQKRLFSPFAATQKKPTSCNLGTSSLETALPALSPKADRQTGRPLAKRYARATARETLRRAGARRLPGRPPGERTRCADVRRNRDRITLCGRFPRVRALHA